MLNTIAADFIVLLHFGFILFVVFGGLLVLKWKKLVWFHIPAALWGALIEFVGWVCPLTPLENMLRRYSGEDYTSSFVEHYIQTIIYPDGLTRDLQIFLGLGVLGINMIIYAIMLINLKKQKT